MVITYSGKSAPSAREILEASEFSFTLNRGPTGDINWGRANANTILNPDISTTTNKRHMRELFKEHGVPMPRLLDNSEIGHVLFRGGAVIGRPDTHTKGRGLWKCQTLEQVRRAYRGTRRKKAATHFMEFVEAPREYRVHIFQGKSIRISEKLFGRTGLTAHGEYITGKPRHEVGHVRSAAKKAVEAVGLDFGAVDILANDTECWVLEVNAAPGLGGSMPRVYAEKFKQWKESYGTK